MTQIDQNLDPDWLADPWVFAYGSLMWNPGFDVSEERPFELKGWHRSLCIKSWIYRGTKDHPGLVLGLDEGGSCHGRLLRAKSGQASETYAYLYAREMVTPVYKPIFMRGISDITGPVLTFVVNTQSSQYCKELTLSDKASIVGTAQGDAGTNIEYVHNTAESLTSFGVVDEELQSILSVLSTDEIS